MGKRTEGHSSFSFATQAKARAAQLHRKVRLTKEIK